MTDPAHPRRRYRRSTTRWRSSTRRPRPRSSCERATCVMGNVARRRRRRRTRCRCWSWRVWRRRGRARRGTTRWCASLDRLPERTRATRTRGRRPGTHAQRRPRSARPHASSSKPRAHAPARSCWSPPGPLTNVALALAEEPALPALLSGFALMGGAYAHAGNITPAAEANIWVDPEAAEAVFRGVLGRLPSPLRRPRRHRAGAHDDARTSTRCASPPRRAPSRRSCVRRSPSTSSSTSGTAPSRAHRCTTRSPSAIAIDPSLAELRTDARRGRVRRSMDTRHDRDEPRRRAATRRAWADTSDNARVALGVDAGAFSARFQERLRGLVEARA